MHNLWLVYFESRSWFGGGFVFGPFWGTERQAKKAAGKAVGQDYEMTGMSAL